MKFCVSLPVVLCLSAGAAFPGCADTYMTAPDTGVDFSSATSDCDLFDDEF